MYLKPASVVNRVYLSLSIYGFRLCQAIFPLCESTDRNKACPGVLSPSSCRPVAKKPPRTLLGKAAEGLGTAVLIPSTKPQTAFG